MSIERIPAQQLQVIDTSVTPNVTRVLARNVTAWQFGWDMAPNPQTQVQSVVHLAITLTIELTATAFAKTIRSSTLV